MRIAAGVGLWDAADDRYLAPQQTADATHPGGAARPPAPPAFFNVAFRLNEPMPQVGDPAGTAPERRLVARQGPGRRARRRRHQRLPRRRRLRQARRADATDDQRRAEDRPDRPHPRQPLRDRPGRRLLALLLREQRGATAPAATRAACSPTRSTSRASRSRRPATGMTLLLHSLGGQLQPVPRQPQPVAVRRARPGLDRDHAAGARARRLLRRATRRPTSFEVWADVARHYKLDPAWTVDHRLLDGRLSAPSSSPSSSRTCSRARSRPSATASDNDMVASLRNIPVLMWNAATDELVPETS